MKILLSILFVWLICMNAKSQAVDQDKQSLTQEQYKQYFPIESQIALFFPTTDYVCILPTNEKDTTLQAEVNEFYKQTFIKIYPTVPHQIARVITDKEALKEDLSNLNIHAFGTLEGNLWIARFMKNTKDFPIKITADSIIADKVYTGNDYAVSALWVNPDNVKHSLTLYIPQHLECAKAGTMHNTFQYAIWEKGKMVNNSYFCLRDNSWHFSGKEDTLLVFRDVNHLMEDKLERISKRIFRFPTEKQLSDCMIDEKQVPFDTIKTAEINKDFSNLEDMKWLKPVAGNYKIIAVGEAHHLQYNKYLLERILFSLNKVDSFPLLVLELPYSFGGYFNYYASLKDDQSAQLFSDSVLSKVYKPEMQLLSVIRNWNKLHPEKEIQIGCSDMEQDFKKTIELTLNPYLKKIDPEANIGYTLKDTLNSYLARAKVLLEKAKEKNTMGDYSFQTPQYMESVFLNLKASIPLKLDRKKFFDHKLHYRIMIRNVTDPRFLGKQVTEGKSVFYGGNENFRILNEENKKDNVTEGYFLAHSFGPTKDKVYTITLNTLAISIEDSIPRIDPKLQFFMEPNLIRLYKTGKIKLNEPVIASEYNDEFERYIYKQSYKHPGDAFKMNDLQIENALSGYEGFDRYSLFIALKRLADYNANIIIPYSPIGD